jgi:hypothetical protein
VAEATTGEAAVVIVGLGAVVDVGAVVGGAAELALDTMVGAGEALGVELAAGPHAASATVPNTRPGRTSERGNIVA